MWKKRYSQNPYFFDRINKEDEIMLQEHLHNLKKKEELDINKFKHIDIKINFNSEKITSRSNLENFSDIKELNHLLQKNLRTLNFKLMTPIQREVIKYITEGNDVMGCAQTGSGKTIAFLLPIIQRIIDEEPRALNNNPPSPKLLIMIPTRELAEQIFTEARKLVKETNILVNKMYGGVPYEEQLEKIYCGCDILVATPGRLLDFCKNKNISLKHIKYLIIDEADRLLDMGFMPQLMQLAFGTDLTPKEYRQNLLFSATFTEEIRNISTKFMNEYYFIQTNFDTNPAKNIKQELYYATENDKPEKLNGILNSISGSIIIFVETKFGVDNLYNSLRKYGHRVSCIHGNKKQIQRQEAIKRFTTGHISILIATDIASRGLDFPKVTHVINYDLPTNIEDFIHRVGRTGRCGNTGIAISFVNEYNKPIIRNLYNFLRKNNQKISDWFETMYRNCKDINVNIFDRIPRKNNMINNTTTGSSSYNNNYGNNSLNSYSSNSNNPTNNYGFGMNSNNTFQGASNSYANFTHINPAFANFNNNFNTPNSNSNNSISANPVMYVNNTYASSSDKDNKDRYEKKDKDYKSTRDRDNEKDKERDYKDKDNKDRSYRDRDNKEYDRDRDKEKDRDRCDRDKDRERERERSERDRERDRSNRDKEKDEDRDRRSKYYSDHKEKDKDYNRDRVKDRTKEKDRPYEYNNYYNNKNSSEDNLGRKTNRDFDKDKDDKNYNDYKNRRSRFDDNNKVPEKKFDNFAKPQTSNYYNQMMQMNMMQNYNKGVSGNINRNMTESNSISTNTSLPSSNTIANPLINNNSNSQVSNNNTSNAGSSMNYNNNLYYQQQMQYMNYYPQVMMGNYLNNLTSSSTSNNNLTNFNNSNNNDNVKLNEKDDNYQIQNNANPQISNQIDDKNNKQNTDINTITNSININSTNKNQIENPSLIQNYNISSNIATTTNPIQQQSQQNYNTNLNDYYSNYQQYSYFNYNNNQNTSNNQGTQQYQYPQNIDYNATLNNQNLNLSLNKNDEENNETSEKRTNENEENKY